jgi:hypothetical protein
MHKSALPLTRRTSDKAEDLTGVISQNTFLFESFPEA